MFNVNSISCHFFSKKTCKRFHIDQDLLKFVRKRESDGKNDKMRVANLADGGLHDMLDKRK